MERNGTEGETGGQKVRGEGGRKKEEKRTRVERKRARGLKNSGH